MQAIDLIKSVPEKVGGPALDVGWTSGSVWVRGDTPIQELPAACADESVAVEFMERHRWGEHPGCPRCGDTDVYQMKSRDGDREKHFRWRCRGCKKQFSVRTGTVFEDSRIPLRHWCFAFWRACTSKKGVSALEIHRQTGLSYKSCLFMLHRIRFAIDDPPKRKTRTGVYAGFALARWQNGYAPGVEIRGMHGSIPALASLASVGVADLPGRAFHP